MENLINYFFIVKRKGTVVVSIEDTDTNPKFKIQGPKEIISQAIAGIGEENEIEAWATEKELDTEVKRMFAVLEVLTIIQKNNEKI